MPLSEDEQRILRQIEHELATDPTFSERGYRVSRRRLVLLAVAVVAGLVLTVAGLTISFWVAFVAFLGVLAAAVALEAELRVIGRERLGSLPVNAWLAGSARPERTRSDPEV